VLTVSDRLKSAPIEPIEESLEEPTQSVTVDHESRGNPRGKGHDQQVDHQPSPDKWIPSYAGRAVSRRPF